MTSAGFARLLRLISDANDQAERLLKARSPWEREAARITHVRTGAALATLESLRARAENPDQRAAPGPVQLPEKSGLTLSERHTLSGGWANGTGGTIRRVYRRNMEGVNP